MFHLFQLYFLNLDKYSLYKALQTVPCYILHLKDFIYFAEKESMCVHVQVGVGEERETILSIEPNKGLHHTTVRL